MNLSVFLVRLLGPNMFQYTQIIYYYQVPENMLLCYIISQSYIKYKFDVARANFKNRLKLTVLK